MEALICKKVGDPTIPPDSSENAPLSVSTSHPIPKLNSPTSVRVRVKANSLNYATYLQVLGKYQEKFDYPFVLGSDYSGVVESVGPNVTKFKVGEPVCSFAGVGSFAQYIVTEEKDLPRVPEGCDLVSAAAIPLAYVRHWFIEPISNLDRGTEKVAFLKLVGVDHVVDLSTEGVIQSVKAFLKTRNLKGVDVLYDPVGGKLTKESMKLLNWGAQILVIGFASGEVPIIPANIALVKNWTIHGFYWGSYEAIKPGAGEEAAKELLSWLARGLLTIHISHSYKIQEANLAFSDIRDRKVIGKVMITFDDPKNTTSRM